MTHGSLFTGIGGFDLGFERVGIQTLWQVEIDDYCRQILAKRFPNVTRLGDIRQCGKHNLKPVDIITGGFPCQPHSVAGERNGAFDPRWLWPDFQRVVCELRPSFVVVENVTGLFTTEFAKVLWGLASIGYDAEWRVISAANFGAPHLRKRIFIVAYPQCSGLSGCEYHARIFGTAQAPYTECSNGAFGVWSNLETGIRSLRQCDGVSVQMVRNMVKPFGNAVLPQIAEWLGTMIVKAHNVL